MEQGNLTTFYIIPPRKITSGFGGNTAVSSLNGLTGDLLLEAAGGLELTLTNGVLLTVSVIPGTFVLQGGDIYRGNLQFQPTGGNYGLRLFASPADPTLSAIGGIYYNTTDNTLKIGTGSTWETLAQTGALTPNQGDTRYLRLDAVNGPLQGDVSLGSFKLQLGLKSADPSSGNPGELYFNTTTSTARLYSGTVWADVGAGVRQINVGSGLTGGPVITSTGSIAVDVSANFAWTGNHSFGQPIRFAASQTFSVSGLSATGQASGDLLAFEGGVWTRVPVGVAGSVLTVDTTSGLPSWESPVGGTIGTPTDAGTPINPPPGYENGFFGFLPSTTVADAVESINNLLAQLAPQKANMLTGTTLAASGPPGLNAAILSAGLPAAWYPIGKSAGTTILSYYTGGSLTLISPNQSNTFRCGGAGKLSTFGILTHLRYDSTGASTALNTIDMTAYTGSVIVSGDLTLDGVSTYNSIWAKGNAHVSYTQATAGYEGHILSHTEAGQTNKSEFWLDTFSTGANASPSFSSAPTVSEVSVVLKWLSGVAYYTTSTQLSVSFAAASGIFNACYNASQVALVACPASPNTPLSPASPPAYTATFDKTSGNAVTITLSIGNVSSLTRQLSVTLYKASGTTASQVGALTRPICTYGTTSTTISETFFDEAQRLTSAESAMTAFNSTTTPLPNNNAQVRSGILQYPVSSDYSGSPTFSGGQEYHRLFYKTSASNGVLTFGGLSNVLTDISPYGTGALNVILWLEHDQLYYDLGVAVNDAPSGASRTSAKGGRYAYSGNQLTWSIGTLTTGPTSSGNMGRFRLIVIFNTSAKTLTAITNS